MNEGDKRRTERDIREFYTFFRFVVLEIHSLLSWKCCEFVHSLSSFFFSFLAVVVVVVINGFAISPLILLFLFLSLLLVVCMRFFSVWSCRFICHVVSVHSAPHIFCCSCVSSVDESSCVFVSASSQFGPFQWISGCLCRFFFLSPSLFLSFIPLPPLRISPKYSIVFRYFDLFSVWSSSNSQLFLLSVVIDCQELTYTRSTHSKLGISHIFRWSNMLVFTTMWVFFVALLDVDFGRWHEWNRISHKRLVFLFMSMSFFVAKSEDP